MPNALSVCMIVKNEERNLARCLDSVQGLAGELIVVDTGSTDETPGIAARYGAAGIALDESAGYFLERYNHSSDSESPFTDYVVRLFPNRPNHRYRGRVHETIDASILAGGGQLLKSDIRIDHTFSSDRE